MMFKICYVPMIVQLYLSDILHQFKLEINKFLLGLLPSSWLDTALQPSIAAETGYMVQEMPLLLLMCLCTTAPIPHSIQKSTSTCHDQLSCCDSLAEIQATGVGYDAIRVGTTSIETWLGALIEETLALMCKFPSYF